MSPRSTRHGYGSVAVALHWASAGLVLLLLPIGWLMPGLEGGAKTLAYRGHLVLGALLLLLTLARIAWRRLDEEPDPPPGIAGGHARAFRAVHVLLYLGLLGAGASGMALSMQSGLGESLFFGDGSIPANLWELRPRVGHRIFGLSVAALTLGHIGGVVLHQWTRSDTLSRIGVRGFPSAANPGPGARR